MCGQVGHFPKTNVEFRRLTLLAKDELAGFFVGI